MVIFAFQYFENMKFGKKNSSAKVTVLPSLSDPVHQIKRLDPLSYKSYYMDHARGRKKKQLFLKSVLT